MSAPSRFDRKSFAIGVLSTLVVVMGMGASYDVFNPTEVERLKRLASYVTHEGDLNMGPRKIIMLGSRIYDDGSQGGGLILQGGANRIHFSGDTLFHAGWSFDRATMDVPNLNFGNRKIVMLGSSIFDDGSQGGGLILRGGANRVHVHGLTHINGGVRFDQGTVDILSNLNLGSRKIIMQGSSIYDDGSQGGGLILRGGANRLHFHGLSHLYNGLWFNQDTVDINANLNLGPRRIIMQGSSIYDDGSLGGGLIIKGGANNIHTFGRMVPH